MPSGKGEIKKKQFQYDTVSTMSKNKQRYSILFRNTYQYGNSTKKKQGTGYRNVRIGITWAKREASKKQQYYWQYSLKLRTEYIGVHIIVVSYNSDIINNVCCTHQIFHQMKLLDSFC